MGGSERERGRARYRLGLIGCGVMGSALVRAAVAAGVVKGQQVIAYDIDQDRLAALCGRLGLTSAGDNAEVVASSQRVLLAVKPQVAEAVLSPLQDAWRRQQVLISILAGVPICRLQDLTRGDLPVVRVMPNILCTVGEAASAVAFSPQVPASGRAWVIKFLEAAGIVEEVDEKLMDAVTGLSGSGPAFAAVVLEALADGGVAAGLPRPQALRMAAQVLAGVGKYVLELNEHPAELKDRVCSPGGTTIAGIAALERRGLRGAIIEAVVAAARRSKELGQS